MIKLMILKMIIEDIKNLNPLAVLTALSISLLLTIIYIDDMIKIKFRK